MLYSFISSLSAERSQTAMMDAKSAKSIFDFTATDINGNEVDLSRYKGTVCIVTNFSIKDSACEKVFSMLSTLYSKFHSGTRKGNRS